MAVALFSGRPQNIVRPPCGPIRRAGSSKNFPACGIWTPILIWLPCCRRNRMAGFCQVLGSPFRGLRSYCRTRVQWRDLPEYFGKWSSVYRQFRRWTPVSGAHLCAASANGELRDRVSAAREAAFRTKILLSTNGKDLPVAVEIAVGPAADYKGVVPLRVADGPEPKALIANHGDDADRLRETMQARSKRHPDPSDLSNRSVPINASRDLT